jgi:hypothetical protein
VPIGGHLRIGRLPFSVFRHREIRVTHGASRIRSGAKIAE